MTENYFISLKKRAEQGDVQAQYELGYAYLSGEGILQDYTKAAEWYRKAAEQGYADAQCELGKIYSKGDGIPQDYVKAASIIWL